MKKAITKNFIIVLISAVIVAAGILLWQQHSDSYSYQQHTKTATDTTAVNTTSTVPEESTDTSTTSPATTTPPTYIEIIDSCGPYYNGECVAVRAGPSVEAEALDSLRNGQVFKVGEVVEGDEYTWYKIVFDEWIRYPDRIEGDWYVAADFVRPVEAEVGDWAAEETTEPNKRIVVDLSEQKLYAYDDEELVLETLISTGLIEGPTYPGSYTIFYKTPTRYMQGPIPGVTEDDYDLPGVPWNLYFTRSGAVIHGAYWHDHFGINWSHGCVNLPPEAAQKLYHLTPEGTQLEIRD